MQRLFSTAILLLCVHLSGCGGTTEGLRIARQVSIGGALATAVVDPLIADAADRLEERLAAGEITEAEYAKSEKRIERANRAMKSMNQALLAVERAIAAYEAGAECGVIPAISVAIEAADRVVTALIEAGVPVPEEISALASMALALGLPSSC